VQAARAKNAVRRVDFMGLKTSCRSRERSATRVLAALLSSQLR
jgi:hypothetical protein